MLAFESEAKIATEVAPTTEVKSVATTSVGAASAAIIDPAGLFNTPI